MKILVCLPVYNEIESLAFVIEQVEQLGYDLIITDGGSGDGTRELIDSLGIPCIDRPGRGKGVGLRLSLEYASSNGYTHLAYVDSDMTYPIKLFPSLIELAENYDMVVGVREFASITFVRRLVNVFFCYLVYLRRGRLFSDVLTGMRVLRVSKFSGLLEAEEFEIEPEMHCLSISRQYGIREVSIPYFKREGESKIGAKAFFKIMSMILFYKR